MKSPKSSPSLKVLASVLALGVAAQSVAAQADPTAGSPPSVSPPSGQYAPPPSGAEASGSTYDDKAQRDDRAYADQYSRWAAQYCVDKHTNTAAGAAIGGVLGAVLGSGLAGHGAHVGGAIAGGAVGAAAGAAVGASSTPGPACPPGDIVAPGAPAFYYDGPALAYDTAYGPAWYQPWVWVDGRWVYRPYRYWYWGHAGYWRPDWRAGPWVYHYRRW
jgi:hypothetical protein